jgi:hypothetical protein
LQRSRTFLIKNRKIRCNIRIVREMAGYLRDLAHRCTRLAGRCSDLAVAQELEGIGAELMEKAHELESACSALDGLG